ncbi:MAG: TetR/AcrR family transcriptional regulator [Mycobacterium sp.]
MNPQAEKKSPYRSRIRAAQAATTRQLVLDTATGLFIERGYAATSIDLIAKTAGIGRSTVFAAAGGKPWLLKTAYDRAVVGDDEQVPLAERPESRELFALTDPTQIVTTYAGILSVAAQRLSPIYEVVRSAAGLDPDVRQLWVDISAQRLTGAQTMATLLKKRRGLRKGFTAEQARDIIWIYNDPGLHYALVNVRGWSQDRYGTWLVETLRQQLLARP